MTTPTISQPNAACHTYLPLADFDWSFYRTGPLPWSPGVWCILAVFTSLAFWSTIHLTIRILFFFKRYRGLYFWSLIITTWSLSIRAAGFFMRWVSPKVPWEFALFLAEAGWVGMVTGFSIVLWSRLNIIVMDRRILRWILVIILVDGLIFQSALIILQFGLAAAGKDEGKRGPWLKILNPTERVQITFFTVQEIIISAFYVQGTYKILHDRIVHHRKHTRKVLLLLFAVQTVCISLDIIVITLDLAGYFTLKAVIHSWVYGIKLELEFVVLNQLVDIAKYGVPGLTTITDDTVPDAPIPESMQSTENTRSTQSTQSQIPSPDSSTPLSARQIWESPPPWESSKPGRRDSSTSVHSRRPSLAQQVSGLGLIPEATESLQHRTLSLDQIGVIPDP